MHDIIWALQYVMLSNHWSQDRSVLLVKYENLFLKDGVLGLSWKSLRLIAMWPIDLLYSFFWGGGLNTGTTNRYSTIIHFCKYFDGCTCTRTYMVLLFHVSSTRLGIPLLHGTNLFSFSTSGKWLVMFE